MKDSAKFKTLAVPNGREAVLPSDISLHFPDDPSLSPQQRSATAYIPWDNQFLAHVPSTYHAFFRFALPYMHARTTNVHTALSVSQLPALLEHTDATVDERAVYLAVILHDIGWSKVSLQGIADSLSYSGLALSETSRLPKEQHVLIGTVLAGELLDEYDFGEDGLSEEQKHRIKSMIRQHDHDAPWEAGKHTNLTLETLLVCDADRLWSYTHENFWQDTVRKNTTPEKYVETLDRAIGGYFFTDQGKRRAASLLKDRQAEVATYLRYMDAPIPRISSQRSLRRLVQRQLERRGGFRGIRG